MMSRDDDTYGDEEAERRANEAIRRSFQTPYKPQRELIGKTDRQDRRKFKSSKKIEKAE